MPWPAKTDQLLYRTVLPADFRKVSASYGVTGTVVVEYVFSLPGLGKLIFQAIANRDLVVVQDVVMLLAATVIAINFVVDVLYAVIDPRLKVNSA